MINKLCATKSHGVLCEVYSVVFSCMYAPANAIKRNISTFLSAITVEDGCELPGTPDPSVLIETMMVV